MAVRNGDAVGLLELLKGGEAFDSLSMLHEAFNLPINKCAHIIRLLLLVTLPQYTDVLHSQLVGNSVEDFWSLSLPQVVQQLSELPTFHHPLFTALITAMRENWSPQDLLLLTRLGAPCTTEVFDACFEYGKYQPEYFKVLFNACGWQMQTADVHRYLHEEIATTRDSHTETQQINFQLLWLFHEEAKHLGLLEDIEKWKAVYAGCFGVASDQMLATVWSKLKSNNSNTSMPSSWCQVFETTGMCHDVQCSFVHSSCQMQMHNHLLGK